MFPNNTDPARLAVQAGFFEVEFVFFFAQQFFREGFFAAHTQDLLATYPHD